MNMSSDDNFDPQNDNDHWDLSDEPKSKSQLKREYHASQDFIQTLLDAPTSHLKKLSLDDDARNELLEAKQLSRGARKREIKFLAKRMHDSLPALEKEYQQLLQPKRNDTRQFHLLEQWRDELLSDAQDKSFDTMQLLITKHGLNAQELGKLVQQARYEKSQNKPSKAARQLFRYLSSHISANTD